MTGSQKVMSSTLIYSTRRSRERPFLVKGVVAHLVEHLVRNQKVVGSSPIYSTKRKNRRGDSFFFVQFGTDFDGTNVWKR